MNIIASHQSGLVEQLEAEAQALAGRPGDSSQRAIVYHHVADMLGLAHGFALLAAHGALGVDVAIAALQKRARRARWRLRRAQRAELGERIAAFGETLRCLDAERCSGVLMAYRLAATPGLGAEAARRLEPDLLAALRVAQSARAQADGRARGALFEAHQHWAEACFATRLNEAIATLEWPLDPRALAPAIAALRIPPRDYDRAERRGLARAERALRRSKLLPPSFAANPAQAFFQLQRHVAERRRREADGVDHLPADEAVNVAD